MENKISDEALVELGFKRQGNRNLWIKNKVSVTYEFLPTVANKFNPKTMEYYLGFKDLGGVFYKSTILCKGLDTVINALKLTE